MALFKLQTKTVAFRGRQFTVRELSAGEREQAKATAAKLEVPFLHQVVFQQTDWPEDARPPSVHVLADEPFEFLEKMAEGIFGMSGLMEEDEKKAP